MYIILLGLKQIDKLLSVIGPDNKEVIVVI
jgi:hypothetical protein